MARIESQSVELVSADGVRLAARVFEPPEDASMTVLMLQGVGIPQRVLRHVAGWFAARGVRALTVDYRGIGESRTDNAATSTATMLNWARLDAVTAFEHAEKQWREPVVLLGHSFGGQMLGLAPAFRRARAAVLVSSQIGLSRHWDGFARWPIIAYWYLILPLGCALFDVLPAGFGFGTQLPAGVAREWARWGRSRDWFLSSEPSAYDTFAAFDRPMLAYVVKDDDLAPPRAVAALLSLFTSASMTKRELSPDELGLPAVGHMGLFKPGPSETIWQEMLDFYRRQLSAAAGHL